jgi:hypothetical protein
MTAIASGTTFDLPNFVGELFKLTPTDTPFLSMIGGLSGGRAVMTKEFTWQTVDNAAAAQPSTLEGDEPVYAERVRAEVKNVLQVFQYGWQTSYSKLMSVDLLGSGGATPAIPATSILGNQPVGNEDAFQAMLKIERAARDVELTFLTGAFQNPNSNASARRTRGMLTAITTNSVNASATPLDKAKIDSLLKSMYDSGAPFRNPVIFANSFQKTKLSSIYGYAPESRNVGGLNINMIETDFAVLGVVTDRHMPAGSLLVADLSVCRPVFGTIPIKGHFFVEEMAKTHAAVRKQLYGEIGLEYGPEQWHGEILNLTTS